MNSRQKKTLAAVFQKPTRVDVPWRDLEALFVSLGAEISEGSGSRVRIVLNGHRADFHRPHPGKYAKPYQVEFARKILTAAGVQL
jgi:HicA toxin of bacterial toxin-antitoxin,